METGFGARKLAHEVDDILSAALKVGRYGRINARVDGRDRVFVIDHMVSDEHGYPAEVWLSAAAETPLLTRVADWFRGVQRRDLMRIVHTHGDVRRTITTLAVSRHGVTHLAFREELCAPRKSRAIATFKYPRGDAGAWLDAYRRKAG